MTILIFCTKFAGKGFFRSKIEKLNTTIEFYIFELVYTQFHNILRLFDVLPSFSFIPSEMMGGYYL